jgi:phenylalanyl-tRNA synthetase alpha chain
MIPENIKSKMGIELHRHPGPLLFIKEAIYSVFHDFAKFEQLDPVVTVENNFDHLLIPADHPSRSPKDTFYLDEHHVLRTHMSAHQNMMIRNGHCRFLLTGDVYRRDAIDRTHYPVFHQMEGVALFHLMEGIGPPDHLERMLKDYLCSAVEKVFGKYGKAQLQPVPPMRFVDSYFPFTAPSWELEIEWNGKWLEVAGCGIVHPEVVARAGNGHSKLPLGGWAFGIGLERLAMLVFNIPDIRLFWCDDLRFHRQFKDLDSRFRPFSTHPNCYKDVAFWIPESYSPNDFYQLVRDHGGDLVEDVELIDTYSKENRVSHCYRLNWRAMQRTLTNIEVNLLCEKIKTKVSEELGGEMR